MSAVRWIPVVAMLAPACGPRVAPPSPPGQSLIVLLPDPVDGSVGRASVGNAQGTVELAAANEITATRGGQPPTPATALDDDAVQRLFGESLDALPLAPQLFVLRFLFDSDEITPQSRALLRDVLSAATSRSAAEVVVIGHTDTMGAAAGNVQLGLKRAESVRRLLLDAGLDASYVETESLGEMDLEIKTADETPEPRNRRVEIAVR